MGLSNNKLSKLWFDLYPHSQVNDTTKVIADLIKRIAPEHQNSFVFKIIQEEGKDIFEIVANKNKIEISGNNPISMASGFNWYLRYYCHIRPTWDNFEIALPKVLPAVDKK